MPETQSWVTCSSLWLNKIQFENIKIMNKNSPFHTSRKKNISFTKVHLFSSLGCWQWKTPNSSPKDTFYVGQFTVGVESLNFLYEKKSLNFSLWKKNFFMKNNFLYEKIEKDIYFTMANSSTLHISYVKWEQMALND